MRARFAKSLLQPSSWLRTASSSHSAPWTNRTVVAPSASSKSISMSVRRVSPSQSQVNARRLGGSISV